MRIVDPASGNSHFEKRRRRYNEAGQPRELTFSCYRRLPFLSRERTCEWFHQADKRGHSDFVGKVECPLFRPFPAPERICEGFFHALALSREQACSRYPAAQRPR